MPERRKKIIAYLAAPLLLIPLVLVFFLSEAGYTFSDPGGSLLKVSIKHPGKRLVPCDELRMLQEEAEKYRAQLRETQRARMQIRKLGECSRERHPVYLELYVDGEKVFSGSFRPGGWKEDGPSFAYIEFPVRPGAHDVTLKMRDSGDAGFDYVLEGDVEFKEGSVRTVEFDENRHGLTLN